MVKVYDEGYMEDAKVVTHKNYAAMLDVAREMADSLAKANWVLNSFHISVADNYYKDVMFLLRTPHSYAIRIANDSTKSFIFKDLDDRRAVAADSIHETLAKFKEFDDE